MAFLPQRRAGAHGRALAGWVARIVLSGDTRCVRWLRRCFASGPADAMTRGNPGGPYVTGARGEIRAAPWQECRLAPREGSAPADEDAKHRIASLSPPHLAFRRGTCHTASSCGLQPRDDAKAVPLQQDEVTPRVISRIHPDRQQLHERTPASSTSRPRNPPEERPSRREWRRGQSLSRSACGAGRRSGSAHARGQPGCARRARGARA